MSLCRSSLFNKLKKGTIEDERVKRVSKLTAVREDKRFELLKGRRFCLDEAIQEQNVTVKKVAKKSLAERLQEYKEAKAQMLLKQNKSKKPIFKTGVVHHTVFGTIPYNDPYKNKIGDKKTKPGGKEKVEPLKNIVNNYEGRMTRNKAKLMKKDLETKEKEGKTIVNEQHPVLSTVINNKLVPVPCKQFKVPKKVKDLPYNMKITFPRSPNIRKSARKNRATVFDFKFSPPVVNSRVLAERKRNSAFVTVGMECEDKENQTDEVVTVTKEGKPETPEKMDFSLLVFSPFINKSRGSHGVTSSNKSDVPILDECDKEDEVNKSRVYTFQKLLESETKILNDKCIEWNEKLNYRTDIPETIQGDIGSVIGKTKMLTSDKFKQFQELIDKFNKMDPMIKINDLQGFWEWMLLDVDKMHEEFFKLSKLEENKWKVEEEKPNVKKVVKKMPVVKKTVVKPKGVSNIRAHILAARQNQLKKADVSAADSKPAEEVKVFDGCFFKVESPVSKHKPKPVKLLTPKRVSSLREDLLRVQASQGLAVVSATSSAKRLTPKPGFVDASNDNDAFEISYINMDKNPGRSILKTPTSALKLSAKKNVMFSTDRLRRELDRISDKYFTKQCSDTSVENSDSDSPSHLFLLSSPLKKDKSIKNFETPTRRSKRIADRNSCQK